MTAMDDARAPLPPTPPIDGLDTARLDTLRDLDPGDTSYLDRAIANYATNSAAALDKVQEAAKENDVDALIAASHKIGGSALNLGVPRAGRAALAVENLARSGSLDGLDALVHEMADAMAEARELLAGYQRTYRDDVAAD